MGRRLRVKGSLVALLAVTTASAAPVPVTMAATPTSPPPPLERPKLPAPTLPKPKFEPSDRLLAGNLLGSPVGTPEQGYADTLELEEYERLAAALRTVAVELELLDPKETGYFFIPRTTFQNDLEILRRRVLTFKDLPPLQMAERLPDKASIGQMVNFNREFRKQLVARLEWEWDRADLLWATIQETDRLYTFWMLAREARDDKGGYVTTRRPALAEIEKFVNEWGEFPPSIPTWRIPPH